MCAALAAPLFCLNKKRAEKKKKNDFFARFTGASFPFHHFFVFLFLVVFWLFKLYYLTTMTMIKTSQFCKFKNEKHAFHFHLCAIRSVGKTRIFRPFHGYLLISFTSFFCCLLFLSCSLFV